MRVERRKHRRAPLPGMRVSYEDAAGQRAEAEVLDIGAGGMFVRCDRPMAVGKGLTVEITAPGDGARWSALGRVAWVRADTGPEGPAGMGVRFVDAEDAMLARVAELVAARERTDPGTGGTKTPAREPTVLGVGAPRAAEAQATPIIAVAPTRETTVLGVGAPEEPDAPEAASRDARLGEEAPLLERSVPIELTAARVKAEAAAPAAAAGAASEAAPEAEAEPKGAPAAEPSEASLAAAGVPRRRARVWPAVLLVLVGAGFAVYAMRARIPWLRVMIDRATAAMGSPQPPAPAPPALVSAISAPASAPSPVVTTTPSTPTPLASASASSAASSSTSPAKKPPVKAPVPRHGPGDKSADNPY